MLFAAGRTTQTAEKYGSDLRGRKKKKFIISGGATGILTVAVNYFDKDSRSLK